MQAERFICRTAGGRRCHGVRWSPAGQPWLRVLLIHGLGEHMGRYEAWAERFVSRGVELVGVDLRGHGRSPGRRGAVPDAAAYLEDCGALVESCRGPIPIALYGHSLGGLLVLEYLRRTGGGGIACGVVTSPWLALAFPPPPAKVWLAMQLSRWFPRLTVHNGLRAESLARPKGVAESYRHDRRVHHRISIGLFRDVTAIGRFWEEQATSVPVPLLLMHGEADRITRCGASAALAQRCGQRITWVPWAAAAHELHHDADAGAVFERVVGWLRSQVS
jgi:acylglycerol lipase